MKYKQTKKTMEIINQFFSQPVSIENMKKLGTKEVSIDVYWETGEIRITGDLGSKVLSITDILDAYYKSNPQYKPAPDAIEVIQ